MFKLGVEEEEGRGGGGGECHINCRLYLSPAPLSITWDAWEFQIMHTWSWRPRYNTSHLIYHRLLNLLSSVIQMIMPIMIMPIIITATINYLLGNISLPPRILTRPAPLWQLEVFGWHFTGKMSSMGRAEVFNCRKHPSTADWDSKKCSLFFILYKI